MAETIYKMRVVRGAFKDPAVLDQLGAKTIEKLGRDVWVSIDEVSATLEQAKMLQQEMVRHYDDTVVPWYMDGYQADNKNKLIVAFGVDDGEGGKIFLFDRGDKVANDQVVAYGISKGIPAEQMDFADIDF